MDNEKIYTLYPYCKKKCKKTHRNELGVIDWCDNVVVKVN